MDHQTNYTPTVKIMSEVTCINTANGGENLPPLQDIYQSPTHPESSQSNASKTNFNANTGKRNNNNCNVNYNNDNKFVGLSSMKKGWNSLMSSIDSALKPSPDDASDTVSIRSDASSDSDNYVLVANYEPGSIDAMFRVQGMTYDTPARNNVVEMASEVIEEENSATTPSEHSLASTYKRRDLVSKLWFVVAITP